MNEKQPEYDTGGLPRNLRWRTYNAFVDCAMKGLTPAAERTWHALFRHAKRDGRVRLAQSYIAKIVGRSGQAVKMALAELEAAELLTKISYGRGRRVSWYVIRAPIEAGRR